MQSSSLRIQAYERIRSQLILGDLPPGSKISEPKLAKTLGIGRTPIREAIQQLEVEGLLQRSPRKGTFVTTPNRSDIIELYEVREGVEGYAVTLAADRIRPSEIDKLHRLCDVLDHLAAGLAESGEAALQGDKLRQFLTADMGFHMVLISAAGNQRLIRIIGDSHAMSRIFGTARQDHTHEVLVGVASKHREILEAVRPGNGEQARQRMESHIRESREQALEHFDAMQRSAERSSRGIEQFQLPQELMDEFDRMGVSLGDPEE